MNAIRRCPFSRRCSASRRPPSRSAARTDEQRRVPHDLIEQHERLVEGAQTLDMRGAHAGIAREQHERAVDAVLMKRRDEVVLVVGRLGASDEDPEMPRARDIAHAGDELGGQRIGEERTVLVDDEEAQGAGTRRAQALRRRVRVIAEPLHRPRHAFLRRRGHLLVPAVDEVGDRLQRHLGVGRDVSHRGATGPSALRGGHARQNRVKRLERSSRKVEPTCCAAPVGYRRRP